MKVASQLETETTVHLEGAVVVGAVQSLASAVLRVRIVQHGVAERAEAGEGQVRAQGLSPERARWQEGGDERDGR